MQGVGGISDIITTTGDMNVDYADIKAVRVQLSSHSKSPAKRRFLARKLCRALNDSLSTVSLLLHHPGLVFEPTAQQSPHALSQQSFTGF